MDIVISPPSAKTLVKYGLTAEEWLAKLAAQGGVCAICRNVPSTGRFVTDHEHAPGWKKMPDEERKLYVRGILCYWCNKSYLGRGITIAKAQNMVTYLQHFDSVRPVKKESRPKAASGTKKVGRVQPALVESSEPDSSSSDSSSNPASPLGFPFSPSK
jgi:hypothetical protein